MPASEEETERTEAASRSGELGQQNPFHERGALRLGIGGKLGEFEANGPDLNHFRLLRAVCGPEIIVAGLRGRKCHGRKFQGRVGKPVVKANAFGDWHSVSKNLKLHGIDAVSLYHCSGSPEDKRLHGRDGVVIVMVGSSGSAGRQRRGKGRKQYEKVYILHIFYSILNNP